MLISICMCTYKRLHLANTLESIAKLILPDSVSLEVVVVDNDEKCSGQHIINQFDGNYPHYLVYKSEPKKNISSARNMCLSEAKGEWLAFIDDDEVADENWLIALLNTATTYDAQVVFGKVISTYPPNTPNWIIEGGFFDRKERVSGSIVSSGACNCTLVSQSVIDGQLFDLAYGLSGGEDADFFHRIYKKGFKLVTSQEAIVSEEVEVSRLNLAYLQKRHFRIGGSFSKYRYENTTKFIKSKYILKMLTTLSLNTIFLFFSCFQGRIKRNKALLKVYDNLGKLCFFINSNIKSMY